MGAQELNLPLYKPNKGAGQGMTPGQQVVWSGEDPELSDHSSTTSDTELDTRSMSSSHTGACPLRFTFCRWWLSLCACY